MKRQNDVSRKFPEGLDIKEKAILELIIADTSISIPEIAEKTSISKRTINRIIKSLKDKGILARIGSTKQVKWQINSI